MENQIAIRKATTEADVVTFLAQLRIYYERDIFPNPIDF